MALQSSMGQFHDSTPKSVRQFPQAIAHRGYSARFPENTMSAFAGAVKAGAHALEIDVHLSRDNVVVLSHDPTLKRCFGKNGKIIDYDWSYLSKLRCLKDPQEGMPRLLDLLEYLAAPGLDRIWVLLDIKTDNNLDNIMRLIARTIREAPSDSASWRERILLGCWAVEYVPLCEKYLPGFPITHIGSDISYARQFLMVPNVSFAILQKVLIGPSGDRFLHNVRAAGRDMFVWTINEPSMMRWSINKRVNGVITDDPVEFFRVCEEYDSRQDGRVDSQIAVRYCVDQYFDHLICPTVQAAVWL